jgi:ASTRA-associated protein 1
MSNTPGSAVPSFILRGHASTIHALHFFASNSYLASADSDGWVVVWSLATKRAVAVWKAHDAGILGLKDWGEERLIT